MSLQQAVQSAKIAVAYMERQRSDAAYDLFYSYVLAKSESLTDQPTLPRQRRLPKQIHSRSTGHQFDNPNVYFKKQYFEVLDVIIAELKHRFQQERVMHIAAMLEKTLLDAAKDSFSVYPNQPNELQLYHNDVDIDRLVTQLKMLPDLVWTYNEQNPATQIKEISKLSTLCQIMNDVCSSKSLLSEISTLLQIAHNSCNFSNC